MARIGDGQTARRVVISEEHITDCLPALVAGVIGHEDCAHTIDDAADDARSAFDQHDHDGLACGRDRCGEFQLRFGERQVCDVTGSLCVGTLAQTEMTLSVTRGGQPPRCQPPRLMSWGWCLMVLWARV